ncbi:holin [Mycobacterium phage Mendokysei]|uniref:Holin n=1 Tax=Mycobacterium phage Mendokysei TaxID=2099637 RepID=A0A2P1CGC7_9CAUD|nr:holin [Mycobacterium phage Mendokysei]AVJ50244.1 holin [Mycobacterium phage Mendokysei]
MTPRLRQTVYLLGTIASAVVSIAALWHGISDDAAAGIVNAIQGIVGLFGSAASATATVIVAKQRKAGAFDEQPATEAVVNGVQAVIEAHAAASKDLELVKNAVAGVAGAAEIGSSGVAELGGLAQQAIRRYTQVATL